MSHVPYKCKHYDIKELVPPFIYDTVHEDVLWGMFDEDVLRFADWLKGFLGGVPILVNAKGFTQSGLRTKDSRYYSEGSMHSVGKALDLKPIGWTTERLKERMDAYEREYGAIPYITRAEHPKSAPSWLHCDTKPTGKDRLYWFKTK